MSTFNETCSGKGYSAHDSLRPVSFYCHAVGARSVQIVGDFNRWFPVPMHRRLDGWWHFEILLHHGQHQYRFLVDGKPELDPMAMGMDHDDQGEPVSLIAVS